MNNDVKPLLLIFPFGLLSHYLRCLAIADHLKHYFTIKFAAHPSFTPFVEKNGFNVFNCKHMNEKEAISQLKEFKFSWLNHNDLEECFLDQVRVIKLLNPVAVLGDAVPTLKMAAEYTGTHYMALLNGYMTKYYNGVRTLPKKHPLQKILNKFPENIKHYFSIKGETVTFRLIHKSFNIIRSRYKLPLLNSYLDEIEGDQTIICDLPVLFPQKQPALNHTCIGPLLYNGDDNGKTEDLHLEKSKKTIYVTMGSSGNWESVLFLNDVYFSHYNIISSGDKKRVLNALHIQHKDFIEPKNILPFTDLIVCHGGNGTIYQALQYSIPLICIPNHFEQEWNTDVLIQNKFAETIEPDTDNAMLIKRCIETKPSLNRKRIAAAIDEYSKKQPDIARRLFITATKNKAAEIENQLLYTETNSTL